MLTPTWRTERLTLRNADLADVDRLCALFNANAVVGAWDPTFTPVAEAEFEQLVQASLAGRNSRGHPFQLQCICTDDGQTIGYYHLVYGGRAPDLIWFGIFVMDPAVQRQRLGSEALHGVNAALDRLSAYRATQAEVWLKNWPALRFWAGAGFNRIIKFDGDPVLTPDSYASVVLQRDHAGVNQPAAE